MIVAGVGKCYGEGGKCENLDSLREGLSPASLHFIKHLKLLHLALMAIPETGYGTP